MHPLIAAFRKQTALSASLISENTKERNIPLRSFAFIRGYIPLRPIRFLLLGALAAIALNVGIPAYAQDKDKAPDKDKAGTDLSQLASEMSDIDSLRPLIPLKLTPEQIDKMAAAITASQAAYDKKLKAIAGPALAKLADQIHDVKQKALKGEPIPAEFDTYAQAAEKQILTSRVKLDQDTIILLAGTLEDILTAEQFKQAAMLDKNAQIKLKKVPATLQKTDAQWFASYITDAIFTVPRIVPLLKEMRAATGAKTASTNVPGSK